MTRATVTRLTHEADGVLGIELRGADGQVLPAFTPGSHIDVNLPGGLRRSYSLVNDCRERDRYELGVGRAPASRGGSSYLHEHLSVGDHLEVGVPRSLFGIDPAATEHVFVAGGIGITPILSMIRWCEARSMPWRLLYCVRSQARAAYLWALAPFCGRVTLHVDEEHLGRAADFQAHLAALPPGAHVYCCGPVAQMEAVAQAVQDLALPAESVHFERFGATAAAHSSQDDKSFTVVLQRSGQRLVVEAGASILDVLERHGIASPHACREGLCRSCELPLLGGEADHRDHVLSDQERSHQRTILPCVSRALSDELVLDL